MAPVPKNADFGAAHGLYTITVTFFNNLASIGQEAPRACTEKDREAIEDNPHRWLSKGIIYAQETWARIQLTVEEFGMKSNAKNVNTSSIQVTISSRTDE